MMRAVLFQAALLCLLVAALAGAQTSSPTAGGQRPDQASAQPAGQTVTIVGCLVQEAATIAGSERRSDAGAANANDYFVRTPAITAPVGSTVAIGSPGTSGSGGTVSGGTGATASGGTGTGTARYRITGLDREQLRPHLGHRVELRGLLTGNMAPPSGTGATTGKPVGATGGSATGSSAGATAPTSGATPAGTAPAADIAGVLAATAIKMVSTSCP